MTTNDMIADVTAKLGEAMDAVKETVATAADTLAELVGLTETAEAEAAVEEHMSAEVADTEDDSDMSDDDMDDEDDSEEDDEDDEDDEEAEEEETAKA